MGWLGEFLRSPGFGGLAAVVAASILYMAFHRQTVSLNEQAAQDRAWQSRQAEADRQLADIRRATNKPVGDEQSAMIGIAVLQHLAATAPDRNAGEFVKAALLKPIMADHSRGGSDKQDLAHANAVNAARGYVIASEKFAEPVPDYIRELATQRLATDVL